MVTAKGSNIDKILFSINSGLSNREQTFHVSGGISHIFAGNNEDLYILTETGQILLYKHNFVKEIACSMKSLKSLYLVDNNLIVAGDKIVIIDSNLKEAFCSHESFDIQSFYFCKESRYFVAAGNDFDAGAASIRKYENGSTTDEFYRLSFESKVTQVVIYKLFLYIATETTLEKWNFKEKRLEKAKNIQNVSSICCLAGYCFISSNANLFYSSTENLEFLSIPNIQPNKMVSSDDEKFLYLIGQSLNIIEISSLKVIFTIDFLDFRPLHLSINSFYLYVTSDEFVKKYSIKENFEEKFKIEVKSQIIDFAVCENSLIVAENNLIKRFEMTSENIDFEAYQSIEYLEDVISCIAINYETMELAVGNQQNTIKLYSLPTLKELDIITDHKLPIVRLFYFKNTLVSFASKDTFGEIIFHPYESVILKYHNFKFFASNSKICVFVSDPLLCFLDFEGKIIERNCNFKEILTLACDEEYLVIIENEIAIWELESFSMVWSVDYKEQIKQYSEIKASKIINQYLLIATTSFIHIFSIVNRIFIGFIPISYKIQRILSNDQKICFFAGNKLGSIKNIFEPRANIALIGSSYPSILFYKSFIDVYTDKKVEIPELAYN